MQGTAGQQQAHMDSQLPARSTDLPWSTSLVLLHRVRGFFCSSGGSFGTQDFPFLLYLYLLAIYSSWETLQGIQPSGADLLWYIEESSGVPVPRSHCSIQVKDFLAGRRSK